MQPGPSAPRDDGRRETTIYCLRCPKTGETRYIGKADDPVRRLYAHIRDAASGKLKYHHGNWIRSLLSAGLAPEIVPLFVVSRGMRWQDAERFFIASARHFDFRLTNATAGGEGLRLISDDDKARVKESLRAAWRKPGAKARRLAIIMAESTTPAADERRREIANRPDVKAKKADALRALYSTEEAKAKFSAHWKAVWSDPEMKAKKSAASKAAWSDPEAAARRRAAMSAGKRLGWARKKAAQAASTKGKS